MSTSDQFSQFLWMMMLMMMMMVMVIAMAAILPSLLSGLTKKE